MRAMRLLGRSVFAAAALVAASVVADGTARADTCPPANPELARGFSLTGWFDEPVARPPDFAGLKALRERGFLHVRLPIAAERVMARFTPAASIAAERRAIGEGLDRLAALGFAVVVDLDGGERLADLFRRDPAAARDAVIEAWRVLGPTVEARVSRKVSAEVLNEPPVDDGPSAGPPTVQLDAHRPHGAVHQVRRHERHDGAGVPDRGVGAEQQVDDLVLEEVGLAGAGRGLDHLQRRVRGPERRRARPADGGHRRPPRRVNSGR